MTGASLYIASAMYFILFGTGVTQSWNYVAPTEQDKRPTGRPAERPTERTAERPAERLAERPTENSTDTTISIPIKT